MQLVDTSELFLATVVALPFPDVASRHRNSHSTTPKLTFARPFNLATTFVTQLETHTLSLSHRPPSLAQTEHAQFISSPTVMIAAGFQQDMVLLWLIWRSGTRARYGLRLNVKICLLGISDSLAPMPSAQVGTACDPLVPSTKPLSSGNRSVSFTDLNPYPFNACGSNWGFCRVFPAHYDIRTPPSGGPGTKLKQFQNICMSNCGNNIEQNSGLPARFSRIRPANFRLRLHCRLHSSFPPMSKSCPRSFNIASIAARQSSLWYRVRSDHP